MSEITSSAWMTAAEKPDSLKPLTHMWAKNTGKQRLCISYWHLKDWQFIFFLQSGKSPDPGIRTPYRRGLCCSSSISRWAADVQDNRQVRKCRKKSKRQNRWYIQHKYRKGLHEKINLYFTRTVLDLRESTFFQQHCRILLWLKKYIWSLKLQMKHFGGSC